MRSLVVMAWIILGAIFLPGELLGQSASEKLFLEITLESGNKILKTCMPYDMYKQELYIPERPIKAGRQKMDGPVMIVSDGIWDKNCLTLVYNESDENIIEFIIQITNLERKDIVNILNKR